MTDEQPNPCIHHRNCAEHQTCLAGVRYGQLTGTDRDGNAQPGLPCWFDGPLWNGAARALCPFKEVEEVA